MKVAADFEQRRAMVRWWPRDPDLIKMNLSKKSPDEAETIRKLLQWSKHKLRRPGTKAVMGVGDEENSSMKMSRVDGTCN